VQRAGSPSAQFSATASIAYTLASQGDLPLALEVIQNSSTGEDPAKANDYISVTGWLAEHHDFEHALELARLIQQAKPILGRRIIWSAPCSGFRQNNLKPEIGRARRKPSMRL
jgi:hypothetical protein